MNLERISKRLSYLLRHSRDPQYADLQGGWAEVESILNALRIDRSTLDTIVAEDRKGRYSYDESGTRIRANQGHSIPDIMVDMECPAPPDVLYHGTATRFLDSILQNGLQPMTRQWVHLSADFDTAIMVGKRHGLPVVLVMDAKAFVADGNPLYRSANGVWQAKEVPPRYLRVYKNE